MAPRENVFAHLYTPTLRITRGMNMESTFSASSMHELLIIVRYNFLSHIGADGFYTIYAPAWPTNAISAVHHSSRTWRYSVLSDSRLTLSSFLSSLHQRANFRNRLQRLSRAADYRKRASFVFDKTESKNFSKNYSAPNSDRVYLQISRIRSPYFSHYRNARA